MYLDFDLERFIREKITRREQSLLTEDFKRFGDDLRPRISGKRVLVIGGAGTIGSNYIKAILRYDVAELCVVDISENGLTELVRDVRGGVGYNVPKQFMTYPINYSDRVFEKVLKAHGPFDIVANFAAHKHVRSEKDLYSIEAMIENNVLRPRRLLEMLVDCPPQAFFCVSTDKAANPSNIMGASKKLMEELILAYTDLLPIKTARFANVAFSNGSLPSGWMERISKRQPWACPLEMRRFFVSPIEAGELCLIASILGKSGDIVIPKLDEKRDLIPFDRVALDLLEALGMEADVCASDEEARERMGKALRNGLPPISGEMELEGKPKWPVHFFKSDTSGEKPFEEFWTIGEEVDWGTFVNLGVVKNGKRREMNEIDAVFAALRSLFASKDVTKGMVVEVLRSFIPTFTHLETGRNLDQKM